MGKIRKQLIQKSRITEYTWKTFFKSSICWMMQKFQAKCHSKIICNCHRAVNCLEQNIVVGLSTTTKLPLLHNHLFSFHHPFLLSPLSYLHQGFLFLPLFPNCCHVISLLSDSLHHNVTIPSKKGVSHLWLQFCTIMEKKLLDSKANIPFYFLSTTSLFSAGTAVSDWNLKKNHLEPTQHNNHNSSNWVIYPQRTKLSSNS